MTDGGASWLRLLWALVIGTISNASLWTTVALMPALQAGFDLTRTQSAYAYIATMGGFLLGNPFLGHWADRFGIAPVLVAASLFASLAYVCAGLAPNYLALLAAQVAVGVGTSVGFAPLTADVSHWFVRQRGLAIALVSSAGYLSGVVWTAVIPRILDRGDWRDVQFVIAGALLLILPLALLLRRQVPAQVLDDADRRSEGRVQSTGLAPPLVKWLLVAAGIGCCVAMAMPQVHLVALCTDLGFTLAQSNSMLSVMLAGGIVSRIVSGLLIDRIGAVQVLLIGSVLQLVALTFYIPLDGLASLYVVSFVFGLAQGGILPSYPMIVRDFMPARSAGAAIGTVSMATQFGMAFGSWLSGWIYDASHSYLLAFVNGIAWNALNIALVGFLLWRVVAAHQREREPEIAR